MARTSTTKTKKEQNRATVGFEQKPEEYKAASIFCTGSMSSNESGEGEIRKAIIEADLVDCMVALPGRQNTQSITTYSHVRN